MEKGGHSGKGTRGHAGPYLDVIVDASRDDLVTGVVEGDSQDLVGVLEGLDSSFFPDIPQLGRNVALVRGGHGYLTTKSQGAAQILAETHTALLKSFFRSREIMIKKIQSGDLYKKH